MPDDPKQSPDTVLYSTSDLTAMGYGSRATIWRRRKVGTLIEPAVSIGNRRSRLSDSVYGPI